MEIRILLNETSFTNLCKTGFLTHKSPSGTRNISITSLDMKKIATGDILTKISEDDTIMIALSDIGTTLIKEIIKRSPVYSQMYYEI